MLPKILLTLIAKILVLICKICNNVIEHETPSFVRVDRNISLSIFKWVFQAVVVGFTVFYPLWHDKAYQAFAPAKGVFKTKVSFRIDCWNQSLKYLKYIYIYIYIRSNVLNPHLRLKGLVFRYPGTINNGKPMKLMTKKEVGMKQIS